MVSKLRNQGHEIAVHSITHRTPGICKQTADELQRKILGKKYYSTNTQWARIFKKVHDKKN